MSTWDDRWDTFAADDLMAEFGAAATYHPAGGGDDVALTCHPGEERVVERQDGDRLLLLRTLEITIATDPTSEWGGVAAISRRATVTYDGNHYSIDGSSGADGSYVTLSLSRPELGEVFPRERAGGF